MKGPIIVEPKVVIDPDRVVEAPDIREFTTEMQVAKLRDGVSGLSKELKKAKKEIAELRSTIQSQSALLSELSASFAARADALDSKIAALENKVANAASHVHGYETFDIVTLPALLADGTQVIANLHVVSRFGTTLAPS